MNKDIFKPFLSSKVFQHKVEYIKAVEVKDYGRNKISYATAIIKDVVFISASAGQMINAGFEKYIDKQNFFCFTKFNFIIGLNDVIKYKNERYQRINSNDLQEYGFNKYIMTIYNDSNLASEV